MPLDLFIVPLEMLHLKSSLPFHNERALRPVYRGRGPEILEQGGASLSLSSQACFCACD